MNSNKEVKKKKENSNDRKLPEKQEKRRSSITGSIVETSSSSNSSDSDGLEQCDHCESKGTMTSETLPECEEYISPVKKIDTLIFDSVVEKEQNKMLVALSRAQNEDFQQLAVSVNSENRGTVSNVVNDGHPSSNITQAKTSGNRRTTKKQSRREKKRKEKEKRNGEIQPSQEVTGKDRAGSMVVAKKLRGWINDESTANHVTYAVLRDMIKECDQDSVGDRTKKTTIQDLLKECTIRIVDTDTQRIVDVDSNPQKRALVQSVPVTFGDFPTEQRSSKARLASSSKAFKTVDGVKNACDNKVELMQVHNAGNELHGLILHDEVKDPNSKFRVAFDEDAKRSWAPAKKTTVNCINRDGLEAENVNKMIDDSNKMAQKYSHWMRSFHNSLIEGDIDVFTNKFNCIRKILMKSAARDRYAKMTEREFKEHVMIGVILQFYNEKEQTTMLHQLASTRNVEEPCSEKRGHGVCKMIKLILGMLSYQDLRSVLRVRTRQTGKTAMHLAASVGSCCQLEALMCFDACPNLLDRSGRAPIHYAVMRNEIRMVKMLLWYGADLSLMERKCTPIQLASLNPCTIEVANFLDARREALEKHFFSWVSEFVRGVWTPHRAVSDLHFLKISREGDSREDAVRSIETSARSSALNIRTSAVQTSELKKYPLSILFIVPTFYRKEDESCSASNPQIFRAALTSDSNNEVVKLIATRPLLKGAQIKATTLEAAFTNSHNGFFYAYQLPRQLPPGTYSLHFGADTKELRAKAPHLNLAIQALLCGPPDFRHWSLVNAARNKTKVD